MMSSGFSGSHATDSSSAGEEDDSTSSTENDKMSPGSPG